MILNERQLRIAQRKLRETEADIRALETDAAVDADDRRVALESLSAFAQQVRDEIAAYEALRSGAISTSIVTLDELPLALIRARIARGLTQAQLGDLLGMKEQQIQRYERMRYAGASLERLKEVASALEITLEGAASVPAENKTEHWPIWRRPLILMTVDALESVWRRGAEGAIEMQKLLVNTDTRLRQTLKFHAFEFEPYKLGPYDPFLEDDIEYLAARKLLKKDVDLVALQGDQVLVAELRTVPLRATSAGSSWLEAFEHGDKVAEPAVKSVVRRIVREVVTDYGALGVADLIARTYAEHPDMTTRSEIREEMTRRAEERGW